MWVVVSLAAFLLLLLLLWWRYAGRCTVEIRGNVLLITAHPDDECMFFAPTILSLTRRHPQNVYLICLSEGGYYGKEIVRQQELYRSAMTLGIRQNHVSIISDVQLPDHPQVCWQPQDVARHVSREVKRHGIETIITFDLGGVSGHPNHTALYTAVRKMCVESKQLQAHVLTLETTGVCRKYAGLLDLPLSLRARSYAIGTLSDYFKARRAMQAHVSQYVWFRRLYVAFSRYMLINTFRELH